jgi:predicted ATP-dependent endonuclease of OLD family
VDAIYRHMSEHTDALQGLKVDTEWAWQKAVALDITASDLQGAEHSLERRGSGMKRLLMVAFFQYLADRAADSGSQYIFGIEEPENCLHPGLQRELVSSFRRLVSKGFQIIITTHSPVFAGASPLEDLVLVSRSGAKAKGNQYPNLRLDQVAEELGIEPADQVTGYKACVFVEGTWDVFFFGVVTKKLKNAGHIRFDLEERGIGFIPVGGSETLHYWTSQRALAKISRRYAVIVDSDRKSAAHNVPQSKLNWQAKCQEEGGSFFILHKREIENYLHVDAMMRTGKPQETFDDFTDMKAKFGDNVVKVVAEMTADEILQRDLYVDNGQERHELKEIIDCILALTGDP